MKISELNKRTKELFELRAEEKDPAKRLVYRNEIVELNIKLVPHMLKKHKPYNDDVYQNGCIGLLKAADMYDLNKGVPFANFACLVIETEIRLAYKYDQRTFEAQMGDYIRSLDELQQYDNDESADTHDKIEDAKAQEAFERICWENNLDDIFINVIIPCVYAYGKRASTIDMDLWKDLEIRYFLEMSKVQSQQQRLTFSEMAKLLGTVPQNIRGRHKQVLAMVKDECIKKGYGW